MMNTPKTKKAKTASIDTLAREEQSLDRKNRSVTTKEPCFYFMYNNPVLSDVIFKVGNSTFFAHKIILANKSEKFYTQFVKEFLDADLGRETIISNIGSDTFANLLKYIYGGISKIDIEAFLASDLELLVEAKNYLINGLTDDLVEAILNCQEDMYLLKFFSASLIHPEIDQTAIILQLDENRDIGAHSLNQEAFKHYIKNTELDQWSSYMFHLLLLWINTHYPNVKGQQILQKMEDFDFKPMKYMYNLNAVDLQELVIKHELLDLNELTKVLLKILSHPINFNILPNDSYYEKELTTNTEVIYYKTFPIILGGFKINNSINQFIFNIQLLLNGEKKYEMEFTNSRSDIETNSLTIYAGYSCQISINGKPELSIVSDLGKAQINNHGYTITKIFYL